MIKAKLYNTKGLNLNDNTLHLNGEYYLHYYNDVNSGKPSAIVYESDGVTTIGTIKYPDNYFENCFQKRKRIIDNLLNEKM